MPVEIFLRSQLLLREQKELRRYIRARVRSSEDAADLFQDLGLVVLQHPTGPADADSFRAWCHGLARNMAAHYWRSESRRTARTPLFDPAFLQDAVSSAELDPERGAELRQALSNFLQKLDEPARDLLVRRYVLEETATQLAESLNKSHGSVRMRLSRLMSTLREDPDSFD